MSKNPNLIPVLAVVIGIGFYSAMDVAMKGAALAIGAYSAFFVRSLIGFCFIAPIWIAQKHGWPTKSVMTIHLKRGTVAAFMGWSFFFALTRIPLAEAIAISFIAPLIALYLAAVILGEVIEKRAIIAAILGLIGVVIIVAGRLGSGEMGEDLLIGYGALILSALLYAWNLILQRQQALVASPVEVSTFQSGIVALVLAIGSPFLLVIPVGEQWVPLIAGAAFAVTATLFLAWGYARAEAQILVPVEYSAFIWAVIFGWVFFKEEVTFATLLGTVLIVFGCLIATNRRTEQSAL